MEQIDALQGAVGEAFDDLQRVAHVQADIGEMVVADMVQRADHAVEERFAADKAVIRTGAGLSRQMFAGAEADLHLDRAVVAEQELRIERAGVGDRDLRQQFLDQGGLAQPQLVTLTTAIEAADGGGVIHRAGCTGAEKSRKPLVQDRSGSGKGGTWARRRRR